MVAGEEFGDGYNYSIFKKIAITTNFEKKSSDETTRICIKCKLVLLKI
jgi:hypothetical protein